MTTPTSAALRDPALLLALLCWVLGLVVLRFRIDWGLPALAVALALALQSLLERRAASAPARLAAAAAAGVVLLVAAGRDHGARWSGGVPAVVLPADDPDLAGFLPEPGGIVYNERMGDFYAGFLAEPSAPWRWQLGFEPALMPPADLEIYRGIQRAGYTVESFLPWARRMTPRDRMLLHWPHADAPRGLGLEWARVDERAWIGRTPRRAGRPLRP